MNASLPACLLQALQAERLSCVAIDPATKDPVHGTAHYCQPLLTLLAEAPHPAVPVLLLLVLFTDQPTCLPQWIRSLATEIKPQPASGVWHLTLANGLPLMLLLCDRGTNPLTDIEILLSADTCSVLPAVVLIDGENIPIAGHRRELPNWYWQLAERSDIALALLACAADLSDILEARKRAIALQCLGIQINAAGKYVWQVRYHGYVAPCQLSTQQSQHLQSACLRINQVERLICESWLALDNELRQLQACGKAWFESYRIDLDIQFVLRRDDPRWRKYGDNGLLQLDGIGSWMGLIENYYQDRPVDFRNRTPDAPPQLAEYYQGRIFFWLHARQNLSWADIAAIGTTSFRLNVSFDFVHAAQ